MGVIEKTDLAVGTAATKDRLLSLVERCQVGDQRAYRLLFQETVSGVSRHLSLLLGPENDIDDLIQLVYLNVFNAIQQFRGQSAFSTWLFRITINVAHQEIRQRRKRTRISSAITEVQRVSAPPLDSPEQQLQVQQQVYEVLDRLPLKKRETYILYFYEGYSLEEIADLLESSVSTIGSRLQSARKDIVKILASRRRR